MHRTCRSRCAVVVLAWALMGAGAQAFTMVVIDAGHGGKDPGCHWNGLVEKNLCLDVAKRLRDVLEARGVKTVMTRDSDKYLDLSERAAISNRHSGVVFVSIHFNASRNHHISGFEVHNRSKKGLALARHIGKGLEKAVKARRREGDWQDYKVLRETKAAAVLVECGFISNKAEAERCATTGHRQALARGIADGIMMEN